MRRIHALCVVGICIVLNVVPVGAQPVRELTPDESVRIGLEQNPRVRAARADAQAAQSTYRQIRAGRLPNVRTQATYTRLSGNIPGVEFSLPGLDSVFTFQSVQLNRYHTELSVEQQLLGFRLPHEIRAASHEAEAAELKAQQEAADVAFEIRRAYWTLYRTVAVRATMAAAVRQVEEYLAEVRNRVNAGTALRRDLLAAQTRRSEVQLERLAAENAVRVAQLELNRLLGIPLDTPVRPVAAERIDSLHVTAQDTMMTPLHAERPELAALAAQIRGLEAQVRAVEGARLPALDFVGRYVYARPNQYFFAEQDRFRGTWELGFSARWDVWQGGRVGAQASEARARVDAAVARLAAAREQVAVDIARQHLEVTRAQEAIAVAAENVAAAEESFRVVRQQFQEGAALSTEVLDAEQALRDAQGRRAESVADLAIARAALLHAFGQVW